MPVTPSGRGRAAAIAVAWAGMFCVPFEAPIAAPREPASRPAGATPFSFNAIRSRSMMALNAQFYLKNNSDSLLALQIQAADDARPECRGALEQMRALRSMGTSFLPSGAESNFRQSVVLPPGGRTVVIFHEPSVVTQKPPCIAYSAKFQQNSENSVGRISSSFQLPMSAVEAVHPRDGRMVQSEVIWSATNDERVFIADVIVRNVSLDRVILALADRTVTCGRSGARIGEGEDAGPPLLNSGPTWLQPGGWISFRQRVMLETRIERDRCTLTARVVIPTGAPLARNRPGGLWSLASGKTLDRIRSGFQLGDPSASHF